MRSEGDVESDCYLNDKMWSVFSQGRSSVSKPENVGTGSFQLSLKLIVVQIVFFSSIFYINWSRETLGKVINCLKYFVISTSAHGIHY